MRAAIASMSCAVEAQSRNPTPFARSRPLAKSSWFSIRSHVPAFICVPRSLPFSSQRSPTVKPSMSRYQAALAGTSFTVSEAAIERSRSDSGWPRVGRAARRAGRRRAGHTRSEEHTSELQSRQYLVCRLLLEKKKKEQETGEV